MSNTEWTGLTGCMQDRARWAGWLAPDGFEVVPDSEGVSVLDCAARVSTATWCKSLRVVEPGAMLEGRELGRYLASRRDPLGASVLLRETPGWRGQGGVYIERGLVYHPEHGFRDVAALNIRCSPAPGEWHSLPMRTSTARRDSPSGRLLEGDELRLWLLSPDVSFTPAEVAEAFGSIEAAANVIRSVMLNKVLATVAGASPRTRVAVIEGLVGVLPGLQPADAVSPFAAEIFADAARAAFASLPLSELGQLSEQVVGVVSDGP